MSKSSLKKITAFVLSLIMVLSVCFTAIPGEVKAAGDVTFTVTADKQELKRGDQVTVKVDMSENIEAYGLTYELYFDKSKLKVISKSKGEAFDEADYGMLVATSDSVVSTILKTEQEIMNGNVMAITFEVLDEATAGKLDFSYDIKVSTGDAKPLKSDNVDNTNLKVVIPATGISVKESTTIAKGKTEKLSAALTPADSNSTVTWKSSNPAIAKVAEDGTVTAVSVGKTKITATANGQSAVCEVTVNNPLESISIEGTASTIKKGTTAQLKVVYNPDDTTDSKKVTWSTGDAKIADVDQNGLVTAIADGKTTITATVGKKTATYDITVNEVKLESISIKESTTIHKGEDETLTVTFNPEDTTDSKNVTWSVSDETSADPVVKVDGNGKVTALRVGEANVTATVGNHTATCKVTVDAPLTAITPEKSEITMVKNQTAEIKYTLDPVDTTDSKEVEFTSGDTAIASVDENGVVTAHKAGTATITLTGANDVTAQVFVTVTEVPINEVVLDKAAATIEKGAATELTATVNPADTTDDDKTITWTSSDESVVTVSNKTTNSGEAVAVTATNKGGTATITATAWNGTKASCEITVPIHLDSIEIPAATSLLRGNTTVLEVTYNPENTTDVKSVTWASDNEAVATVDATTGKITAITEGTANVTATTVDGKLTATTKVTVTENHLTSDLGAKIAFDELKEALLKGQSLDMNGLLNLRDLMEKNAITDDIYIKWSVENEEVAAIDQNGVVTGLKEGKTTITAEITATDASGKEVGTYKVTTDMKVKEIPLDSIAFDKVITEMTVGQIEKLGIIYNPDNTTDLKDVVWTSSDDSILSVVDGKITALKAGVAEITAKVGDKTVSCKITVKPNSTGNNADKDTGKNNGNKTGKDNKQNNGVKTGEESKPMLYSVLMMMAMAVIVITLRKRIVR